MVCHISNCRTLLLRFERLEFCTTPGILLMVPEIIFSLKKNLQVHLVLTALAMIALYFFSPLSQTIFRGQRSTWNVLDKTMVWVVGDGRGGMRWCWGSWVHKSPIIQCPGPRRVVCINNPRANKGKWRGLLRNSTSTQIQLHFYTP